MNTIIPWDFWFPYLKYSGRSDLLVHVERFNDMTEVQSLTHAHRCRVFLLTLDKRAQEWYQKLPRRSIQSFKKMFREFVKQFRKVVAPENDMMELLGIKQGENETLREFLNRNRLAVLDLRAFNHPQVSKGLKKGVKIGRLWYNLQNPATQSYFDVYEQTKRDVDIEEEKARKLRAKQLERLKKKRK